jgi:site-specific DNA-methyltransferase (adenine-specific)
MKRLGAGEAGALALGDCLEALDRAPPKEFDLVYVDPPYGIGRSRGARTQLGQHRAAGPTAYGDARRADDLVPWLCDRLARIRERLAPHATIWLHMDHRAVHATKVGADRVFGRGAFRGEVIWEPGNGARGGRALAVTHQTLLLYAAGPSHKTIWNARDPELREPFAATSLAMHFKRQDPSGRAYRDRTIGGKTYRYYADEGRTRGSVWTDLPAMVANSPLQRETSGYPTQKPLGLLARIVRASSEPGMAVLDPMCGSGTTCLAAAGLGRRFAGIDSSELAIQTARERLDAAGVRYAVR